MAFKKSAATAGPRVWTVAELGAFYTEHRSELLAETELTLTQVSKTDAGAANIFISQRLTSDSAGFSHNPVVSHGGSIPTGSTIPPFLLALEIPAKEPSSIEFM